MSFPANIITVITEKSIQNFSRIISRKETTRKTWSLTTVTYNLVNWCVKVWTVFK
jgi:hypothetical protein